jgi:hypothetical protein
MANNHNLDFGEAIGFFGFFLLLILIMVIVAVTQKIIDVIRDYLWERKNRNRRR